ncbi:MAG: hypothetical protein KA712_09845 [Myxococcales bacterium]|nr:hypothetical protein [Myxococcales bacterium]
MNLDDDGPLGQGAKAEGRHAIRVGPTPEDDIGPAGVRQRTQGALPEQARHVQRRSGGQPHLRDVKRAGMPYLEPVNDLAGGRRGG